MMVAALLDVDSMGLGHPPSLMLLLPLWPGCVEEMVAAILWLFGHVKVVGVVAIFVRYMHPGHIRLQF